MKKFLIVLSVVLFILLIGFIIYKFQKNKMSKQPIKRTKGGINNPGNIRNTNIKWGGEITLPSDTFESFDTIENGIRAMNANLQAYANLHNIHTIRGIINRWAPASDNNNVEAYIKRVSTETGIDPDTVLSMFDYAAVIVAMSKVEGTNPVKLDTVKKALNL